MQLTAIHYDSLPFLAHSLSLLPPFRTSNSHFQSLGSQKTPADIKEALGSKMEQISKMAGGQLPKFGGQTITDRVTAAKHSLAGSGLAKAVCKVSSL